MTRLIKTTTHISILFIGLLTYKLAFSSEYDAIYNVDTLSDDKSKTTCDSKIFDDCSLRGAINAANNNTTDLNKDGSVSSWIRLPNYGDNTTYTLTNGSISIATGKNITISSTSSDPVATIIKSASSRIFSITGSYSSFATTVLKIENFTLSGSSYTGGVVYADYATVEFNNSILSGSKSTSGKGAAVYAGYSTVKFNNSILSDNIALSAGAVYAYASIVEFSNSILSGNIATSSSGGGGAVYAIDSSIVEFNNTTLNENTANYGGAVYATDFSTVKFNNTTLSNNISSGMGGAVYTSYSSMLEFSNSTLSGNIADYDGGAVNAYASIVNFNNSTIANNSSYSSLSTSSSIINLKNTIFLDANMVCYDYDGYSVFYSEGNNILSDSSCDLDFEETGDQIDSDIGTYLGELADNGGPTYTHALLEGSSAIDAGSCYDSNGEPIEIDQRGYERPAERCDIGAYEKNIVIIM